MTSRITKRSIDALKPGEVIWDGELKGFGARCQQVAKSYIVKGRIRGKVFWYTIGRHGSPFTPDTARKEAKIVLGKIAQGIDPRQERKKCLRELNVSQLCDLYMEEGVDLKKKSTLDTDRGRIERHIKPLLGTRPISDLTSVDMERFMKDVADGKTALVEKTKRRGRAVVKGGRGTASRTVGLLGGILSFAVRRELIEKNPVSGVRRYKDKKAYRTLSEEEVSSLGNTLDEMGNNNQHPNAVAAVRLLLLTGMRRSEVTTLRWDWIDLERGFLHLGDSKTGQKIVPLSPDAVELLKSIPKALNSPFVFPGADPSKPYVGLPKVWRKIRSAAGMEDVRLHDLRHHYASTGAAGGISLYILACILGHRDAKTTEKYAHLADDPQKIAVNSISSQIASSLRN